MMISSGLDAIAIGVDDLLAVFLGESAKLTAGETVEHSFGRADATDPERRYDERPVDEDRMSHPRVDKRAVFAAVVVQPAVGTGRVAERGVGKTGVSKFCSRLAHL